jgi:hypothetical protein
MSELQISSREKGKGTEAEVQRGAYEFDEGLVAIGTDVALGVDDLAEGLAELDELLLCALPGEVAEVEDLRGGLGVPELGLPRGRHLGFLVKKIK